MSREYEQYKRDKESKSFYNSSAWIKCRDNVMMRDHYLCSLCLMDNKIVPADLVHHIVYLRDNWDRGLDETNLISVCHHCHERIHKDDRLGKKKTENKKRNVRVIKG